MAAKNGCGLAAQGVSAVSFCVLILNIAPEAMLGKSLKIAVFPILSLLFLVFVVSVFEGLSNIFLVVSEIMDKQTIAERMHTKYDPEIGWINIPGTYIPHMYGDRKYLKTNAQSFRNNEDFTKEIPSGKARIICSGDSFTLGYGVDNDNAWCQRLSSLNRNLQTINMGQGGYGIDQMYLWYKRNSQIFDHSIHVFAFITGDFDRMKATKFFGYGKPILELKDDELVVRNVPVPKRYFFRLWLNDNIAVLQKLHVVQLMNKLISGMIQKPSVADKKNKNENDEQIRSIALKAFEDLDRISREKDARVIFVYLPTRKDYTDGTSEPWRRPLHEEMKRRRLLFIDLIDEFRDLSLSEVERLFFGLEAIRHMQSAGHYTEEGNIYIARRLYRRMLGIDEIASRLPGNGTARGRAE